MKLLLDQNLSQAFVVCAGTFVFGFQPSAATGHGNGDRQRPLAVRQGKRFCHRNQGCADFVEMSALHGHPPKIIWLNLGNVSNKAVQAKLLDCVQAIGIFLENSEDGVLEVE